MDGRALDAVVVGGGFAGVTAARDLSRMGHAVLLLEARDRLGGRTFRRRFADTEIELEFGGQWLCLARQPYMAREIARYALPLSESPMPITPFSVAAGRRRQGVVPVPPEELPALEQVWFALMRDARRLDPHAPLANPPADLDIPLVEWLRQFELPPFTFGYLTAWGAGVFGCPVARVPALGTLAWIADYGCSVLNVMLGETELLHDGPGSLIRAMIEDSTAEVRLDTPVRHVAQEAGYVTVTTSAGERIAARAAVMAVPLNTLRDIEFAPALNPARRAAADEGHIGHSVKVWALVEGAPPGYYGAGEGPDLLWLTTQQELPEGSLMLGFGPGPGLMDVHSMETMQRNLDVYMDGARVRKVDGHDWSADPYARGAWAGFAPGQLTRYGDGLRVPDGRLFFAGSDIATRWCGFMEGALDTGARAAIAVDALIRA